MLYTEDIPNVCNVNLPNAFSNVAEKTITSNGQVLITMLDVHENLKSIVNDSNPLLNALLAMLRSFLVCLTKKSIDNFNIVSKMIRLSQPSCYYPFWTRSSSAIQMLWHSFPLHHQQPLLFQ